MEDINLCSCVSAFVDIYFRYIIQHKKNISLYMLYIKVESYVDYLYRKAENGSV